MGDAVPACATAAARPAPDTGLPPLAERKARANLVRQLRQAAAIEPDHRAHPIQRQRRRRVGRAHEGQRGRVHEMPVDRVAAIDGKPSRNCRQGQLPPPALQQNAQAARGSQIGQTRHDEADGNVPVRRRHVDGAEYEQGDSRRQRKQLPGAEVFGWGVEKIH